MRPNRRLASLALAATAGLALAACSSTVDPTFDAAPMTQKVAVAADTGAAPHTPPRPPTPTHPPPARRRTPSRPPPRRPRRRPPTTPRPTTRVATTPRPTTPAPP